MPKAALLGGSWDLVPTSKWTCDPTSGFSSWPYIGYPIISRAISPAVSGY